VIEKAPGDTEIVAALARWANAATAGDEAAALADAEQVCDACVHLCRRALEARDES
jgi:hypothetical protein